MKYYTFKNVYDEKYMCELHPVLTGIFYAVIVPWLHYMGIKPMITRTKDLIQPDYATTKIHMDCRAMDIRTKDWPKGLAQEFERDLNLIFAHKYGAISIKSGVKVFALVHDGTEEHLHIQVRRNLDKYIFLEDFFNKWVVNGTFERINEKYKQYRSDTTDCTLCTDS